MQNQEFIIESGVLLKYNGCESHVEIPPKVTAVGKGAFAYNKSLRGITVPDGVTVIHQGAFQHCTLLTEVSLPESLVQIEEYAFQHCYSLEQLALPTGLKELGMYAFEYCKRLRRITLSQTVTTVEKSTFSHCDLLDAACGAWRLKIYGTYWDEGENGPVGHYDDYESYHYFKPEDCIFANGQVVGFVYELVDKMYLLIKDHENKSSTPVPYYREDVRLYHLERYTKA